jgi:cell division septation protein DedD
MNSLFDEDDREEPGSNADLTLGIGSLLSIFFGIVLICGIFFGFGYSMGRRNARSTAATVPVTSLPAQTAATSPLPPNELSGAPLKPQSDSAAAFPPDVTSPAPDEGKAPKPSSSSRPAQAKASADDSAKAPAPARTAHVAEPAANSPSLSAVPVAHHTTPPAKPHAGISEPLAQAPGDSPIIPGHPIMVQIAAISRQEDAEVLAGALRKHGFNPSVRAGTTDKLFHVQVGPFTDKAQAESIKQHLLADGYNAIMK